MFPREVFVMKIHVISFNENLWEIDKIKVLKNLDFKQYVLISWTALIFILYNYDDDVFCSSKSI